MSFLFTSESVTRGHPDKLADAISDAVLDAHLEQDPGARVACETYVTKGLCLRRRGLLRLRCCRGRRGRLAERGSGGQEEERQR